jgi:ATP-dependent helicase HrpA
VSRGGIDHAAHAAELARAIDGCMLADRHRLRRRLRELQRRAGEANSADALAALALRIDESRERAALRRQALPRPRFEQPLPVTERRREIADLIAGNQVVIVCGETGSGKSTQLPQICLDLGRGAEGMIGHTQPRRIAARSIAARVAAELGGDTGAAVGYKVRFKDRVSAGTYVKVMTDGILLAEIQSDRYLDQYDTLIIDEAHERSLNIDFLLGYLKHLLPKRPELKLVVTSATIDPRRFSHFFDDAPIVEVSGRTYPVELRYRPPSEERAEDTQHAVLAAVDELAAEGPGDVLVFLSGEREIRDTAEALRKHHPPGTEILPLYARLSAAEQDRIFQGHSSRRIVLATNVAETSLTVPGIRYVVDPGRARISRYAPAAAVQRLPVEPVSQASSDQRAGRCGRVADGICIRLYSEDDYQSRPRFTDPEIQRTSLAAVILRMQALRLGEVERFPFIDPPHQKLVNDGYRTLHELGAVDEARALTETGRKLARLPVDPRLGRMLLAAGGEGCVSELLVISAALAVQDPRERPHDAREAADAAHRELDDERSDFSALLKLWDAYQDRSRHLSNSKLRAWCREHFLSYLRMREWRDTQQQLHAVAGELGLRSNSEPGDYASVHRAVLSGLVANVAQLTEEGDYRGARGRRLLIFPGSGLKKRRPRWIVAAEMIETSRLFAHRVATIEPQWVEAVAPQLVRRTHLEPHWDPKRGQVTAYEQVSLYGLVLVARRRMHFGPIDPELAREIFIRGALVEGRYAQRAAFLEHNRKLIAEVEALEHKSRRRDVLADDQALIEFFDQRVPAGVYSARRFERWRRAAEADDPQLLMLRREDLMQHDAVGVTAERYPATIEINGMSFRLRYRFEPGREDDGITVTLPEAALSRVQSWQFDRLVPGLLHEKITALIKSLPKSLRRHFVPAPDFARACVETLSEASVPLVDALSEQLERMTGVAVPGQAWRPETLPPHLMMNFRIVDAAGKVLARGRDLDQLRSEHGEDRTTPRTAPHASTLSRHGLTAWTLGELPRRTQVTQQGMKLPAYPALVDRRDSVDVALFDTEEEAHDAHRAGLRRLFALAMAQEIKYLRRNIAQTDGLCLRYARIGPCDQLIDDILQVAVERCFELDRDDDIRSEPAFTERLNRRGAQLVAQANELCAQVSRALEAYHEVVQALAAFTRPDLAATADDVRAQVDELVFAGFVSATPPGQLPHLPRYLQAAARRLARAADNPSREAERTAEMFELRDGYRRMASRRRAGDPDLSRYRWMLEEYRVSVFAQELKTAHPVSPKRLARAREKLA